MSPNQTSHRTPRSLDDPTKMTLDDERSDSRLPGSILTTIQHARQPAYACACTDPYGANDTMQRASFTTDSVSATYTLIPLELFSTTPVQLFSSLYLSSVVSRRHTWEAFPRRITRPEYLTTSGTTFLVQQYPLTAKVASSASALGT